MKKRWTLLPLLLLLLLCACSRVEDTPVSDETAMSESTTPATP